MKEKQEEKTVASLHIDLTKRPSHNHNYYHKILRPLGDIRFENRLLLIAEAIQKFDPNLVIFEYENPDPYGLLALQQTKTSFPSLPILMLTDYHSEELAVWAFRSGVRDYLSKPVHAGELISRVKRLIRLAPTVRGARARNRLLPMESFTGILCLKAKPGDCKTAAALAYIQANLQEKITLKEMAGRCGISPSRFSHVFRQEHGITFQEFLLRERIRRAQRLLNDTGKSVTEVAYTVGFGDLSYFTRVFRRYVGSPPTAYRLREES